MQVSAENQQCPPSMHLLMPIPAHVDYGMIDLVRVTKLAIVTLLALLSIVVVLMRVFLAHTLLKSCK